MTYRAYIPSRGTSFAVEAKDAGSARRKALRQLGWTENNVRGTGFYVMREKPLKNPAVKLPSKFTPAEVRVNEQGKVQIRINPAKLGSGGRFAKCVESVEAKGGAVDPRAVCAAAGRAKYGKRKFQAMAAAGRKRAARGNPSKRKTEKRVRVALKKYVRGQTKKTNRRK